jgi:hypothetical protein
MKEIQSIKKRWDIMRISIDIATESKGKYLLEKRRYSNYGRGGRVTVSAVGIYDTEAEAKLVKKALLSKKHEPYSLMFKIRKIA